MSEELLAAVPRAFYCEHATSRSRVLAVLARPGCPDSLRAVLTCADPDLAQAAADLLQSVLNAPVADLADRTALLADRLPPPVAASLRQAVQWVATGTWPVPSHTHRPDAAIPADLARLPDFAALFPVARDLAEDDEFWPLTPRTAAALYGALGLIADWAYDDAETHGDDPVDPDGDWLLFDELPRISWRRDGAWRRDVARAADDLSNDIAHGRWPVPRCNAEELLLHLAIDYAADMVKDGSSIAVLLDLPEHEDDYDWGMCSEELFQDHDVLLLYDDSVDGIEDPQAEANRRFRIGDLRPANWLTPFDNAEPRDPGRGHRMSTVDA
jgi:hypothetical protein